MIPLGGGGLEDRPTVPLLTPWGPNFKKSLAGAGFFFEAPSPKKIRRLQAFFKKKYTALRFAPEPIPRNLATQGEDPLPSPDQARPGVLDGWGGT